MSRQVALAMAELVQKQYLSIGDGPPASLVGVPTPAIHFDRVGNQVYFNFGGGAWVPNSGGGGTPTFPDGTMAAPGIAFTAVGGTTGFYRTSGGPPGYAGAIAVDVQGQTEWVFLKNNGGLMSPGQAPLLSWRGSLAAPGLSFTARPDTGLSVDNPTVNGLSVSVGGVGMWMFRPTTGDFLPHTNGQSSIGSLAAGLMPANVDTQALYVDQNATFNGRLVSSEGTISLPEYSFSNFTGWGMSYADVPSGANGSLVFSTSGIQILSMTQSTASAHPTWLHLFAPSGAAEIHLMAHSNDADAAFLVRPKGTGSFFVRRLDGAEETQLEVDKDGLTTARGGFACTLAGANWALPTPTTVAAALDRMAAAVAGLLGGPIP